MSGEAKALPQIFAAFAATLGAFAFGLNVAWVSAAVPSLKSCDTDNCKPNVHITDDDESWIGGIFFLGSMVASPIVGQLVVPRIGCKWSMIALSVPLTLGWTIILITRPLDVDNLALFYVGRILLGFSSGSYTFLGPIYIGEMCEVKFRGAFSGMMQFMITVGIAFENGLPINNTLDWFQITIICAAFQVVIVLGMLAVPDTPVYLLKKGRREEARKSLERLRGKDYYNLDQELNDLQESVTNASLKSDSQSLKTLFTSPIYLKPLGIVIVIQFLQQWGGATTVTLYTQQIFIQANTGIDPGLGAFLVMVSQLIATGLGLFVVDRAGRRILLMISIGIMGVTITGLGTYFYLSENNHDVSNLGWLPLACLVIFIVAFSLGMGPITWSMNVELHSREAQSVMSSTGVLCNSIFAFLMGKFVTNIQAVINTSGMYFLNGGIDVLGLLFIMLIVPETKGKTPEEMKKYFQR